MSKQVLFSKDKPSTANIFPKKSPDGLKSQVDNRPESQIQRKVKDMANTHSLTPSLNPTVDVSIDKKEKNVIQQKKNNTGLPDNLKSGIENLSGISMDDVQVHRNSGKPKQLQAHAYAQGTDIHLSPGQEKHLPHEAWHVVQQKQGRVKPTIQMNGSVPVNDDNSLEKEADIMGGKANGNQIAIRKTLSDAPSSALTQMKSYPQVFQLRKLSEEEIETMDKDFLEFFRQLEDALKPFLPKKSNEEKRSSDFQERGNTLAKSGIKVLKGEEKLSSAVSEQVTTSDKIDLLKKASEIGSSFLGSANSSNQSEGRSPSNQTSTEKNESAKGGFLDSFDLFSSSEPKEKPKKEKRKVENESPSIFSSFFSNKDSPTSRGEGKQSSGTSSGILEGLNEGELRAASKILVKGAKAKVNVDEGQRRAENGVVNTFGRIGGFLGKGIGKVEDFFADNGLVSKGESDIQSLESQYQRIVSKIDQIKDPEAFRQAKDLYHQRDQAAINHLERFRMLIVEYKSDPKASQNRAQEHLFELQETNPGEPGILGKTKGVFNAIGNAFSSGAKSISNFASETATSAKKTFGEIKEEANRSIFDKKISFLDEVEEKL